MTKTKDIEPDPPLDDTADPAPPAEAEPRPAGPLDDAIPPPDNVELLAMILGAAKIEVVFSDGTLEVAGVAALVVTPEQFNPTAAGLQLRAGKIEIEGPAGGATVIAGYALFLDDIQAAWAPRAEPLQLHAGGRFNLTDDVVFPG